MKVINPHALSDEARRPTHINLRNQWPHTNLLVRFVSFLGVIVSPDKSRHGTVPDAAYAINSFLEDLRVSSRNVYHNQGSGWTTHESRMSTSEPSWLTDSWPDQELVMDVRWRHNVYVSRLFYNRGKQLWAQTPAVMVWERPMYSSQEKSEYN